MSARAIYEKGVDLKKGGKRQDFSDSDGYYLHKMLKPGHRRKATGNLQFSFMPTLSRLISEFLVYVVHKTSSCGRQSLQIGKCKTGANY